ncbi:MAG: hypothetical protein JSS62_00270 [Verrucomicrobia bacterium]|nr:hypothetical protein [Verrucomicrobiota bacterium]MBS0646570.1 hypothetical protein [Verrucomicrobiota bacterium]
MKKTLSYHMHLQQQLSQLKTTHLLKSSWLEWESRMKWEKVFKQHKLSERDLSDMIFYIENPIKFGHFPTEKGTGNIFFDQQDTYTNLEKRLSQQAKNLIQNIVIPHFQQWKDRINHSCKSNKIYNRQALEASYLPHFYQNSCSVAQLSSSLTPNQPFTKKRKFLTYHQAWKTSEKKPKFQTLPELLNAYDRMMTRSLLYEEFIQSILELDPHLKPILEADSDFYSQAKQDGWISCDNPVLYKKLSKSTLWDTLGEPLLLHPYLNQILHDLSPSQPGNESSIFWRLYDKLSDFLKTMHVSLSGFHYLTLIEESAKSSGWNIFQNYKKGKQLFQNTSFIHEFIENGGVLGHNPEVNSHSFITTPLQFSVFRKIISILHIPSNFLFQKFQPYLKLAAFYDMRQYYLHRLIKKGESPNAKTSQRINQELCALSNDMFGGQKFEIFNNITSFQMFNLQDPIILKRWRRCGGYVDWTVSAIKEFIKTFQGIIELFPKVPKTPTGTLARRNFFRYLFNLVLISQLLSYLFTGLTLQNAYQLKWNWHQSHSTFSNQDPIRNGILDIQLPDLHVALGNCPLSLGRDLKERRLYTHFGKKLLENFHYFQDPIRALYNKSNPLLQIFFIQLFGGPPTLEGIPLKEQQTLCLSASKAWQGKQGWQSLFPRLRHVLRCCLPYSLQSFEQRGLGPGLGQFLVTGLGSLPVRKGLNLKSAEKLYAHYLCDETRYAVNLSKLDLALQDNGYTSHQIQQTKQRASKKGHTYKYLDIQSFNFF